MLQKEWTFEFLNLFFGFLRLWSFSHGLFLFCNAILYKNGRILFLSLVDIHHNINNNVLSNLAWAHHITTKNRILCFFSKSLSTHFQKWKMVLTQLDRYMPFIYQVSVFFAKTHCWRSHLNFKLILESQFLSGIFMCETSF